MSRLTMLSGLPASGKSTRAEQIIRETGNTVRVNRDLLRTMLHFDKWSGKNERITIEVEKIIAKAFLIDRKNVIIDDTNLGTYHKGLWSEFASDNGAKFEHVHINTPWQECIIRDLSRTKSVGVAVIKNMALQYGLVDRPSKGYVLCDIDGTLADITHRLEYAQGEKKDWGMFFGLIHRDDPRHEVISLLCEIIAEGYTPILVSARPEEYRDVTEKWLAIHHIPYWTLLMRKTGDKREDSEVKQQILYTYFPDRTLIHKVIDDRPRVIRMWREHGLDVIDVGKGIEF